MHNNVRLTSAQASRLVSIIAVGGKLPRRDPVDRQLILAGWCVPWPNNCVRTVPGIKKELYRNDGKLQNHLVPKDWGVLVENPT